MRVKFTLPITLERDIGCLGCDNCKSHEVIMKKGLLGFGRQTDYKYECVKLQKPLEKHNINSDDMPCEGEFWQQTNEDFYITEDEFTLHYADRTITNESER